MQLIFGHDAEVGAWAAQKIGIPLSPPFVAIGVADEKELRGAAIYNNWNGWQIEMSIYGPGCLTRGIIRSLLLAYPFDDIGAGRVTARTKRSNKAMQKLFPRLGFEMEGVLKRFYGPTKADDAFIYRLDRQAAERWR